jgi:hypothetical protein
MFGRQFAKNEGLALRGHSAPVVDPIGHHL